MEVLMEHRHLLVDCLSKNFTCAFEQIEDWCTVAESKSLDKEVHLKQKTEKLLDLILGKGEETCDDFVNKIQQVQYKFPGLESLFVENKKTDIGNVSASVFAARGGNAVALCLVGNSHNWKMPIELHTTTTPFKHSAKPVVKGTIPKGQKGVSCDVHADDKANAVASVIVGSNTKTTDRAIRITTNEVSSRNKSLPPQGALPKLDSKELQILKEKVPDKMAFLTEKRPDLVQKVQNIEGITDLLSRKCFQREQVARIQAKSTTQDKMRQILDFITTPKAAEEMFEALCHNENCLVEQLIK